MLFQVGTPVRRLLLITLPCLALTACPRKEAPAAAQQQDAELVSQIKSGLTERERRLSGYELAGTVTESGKVARFEFVYRAPGRMKGTLWAPSGEGENAPAAARTYAFDGERLFEVDEAQRTVTTYEVKLPPEKSAVFLHQIFGAFVPEGFRTPVLDFKKAHAKKVTHPRGPDAVELTSASQDEAGQAIEVTYVLRWPSLDLLEKRLVAGGKTMTVTVDKEQCDEKRKLCVPTQLTQSWGQQAGAVTALSKVELGATVPTEAFAVSTPEGFTQTRRELVETTP